MSLDQLKKLEDEARDLEIRAERDGRARERVQKARTSLGSWEEVWGHLSGSKAYSYKDELAMAVLTEVIDGMRHDILRIVELRLAASERELKVKAAQRRAVISACVLPVPVIDGGDV